MQELISGMNGMKVAHNNRDINGEKVKGNVGNAKEATRQGNEKSN